MSLAQYLNQTVTPLSDYLPTPRHELWTALENCRLLAARHHTEEWASHILRFCSDVGVTGSPLRTAAARKEGK